MKRFAVSTMVILTRLVWLCLVIANPPTGLAQPAIPMPREPASGATVTQLAFGWRSVPEAARYEIEVWTMQAGIPTEKVWEATTYATAITPRDTANIPQGDLSWRVRAIDANGRPSAWGQSQLRYQIDIPALINPPNAAMLSAADGPSFAWSAAAGAAFYQIDVASDPAFEHVAWSAQTADTSITPTFPIGNDHFYWRVRGHAPGGTPGRYSIPNHFTRIVNAPENLLRPENEIPTFEWDPVAGATSYTIQVSERSDFSGPFLWQASTVNTQITAVRTSLGTETRYWRVLARDSGGFVSPWTEGIPFALNSPNGVITLQLLLPEQDAVLTEDPAFQWQWVEDADHYVLEVSTVPSFNTLYDRVETDYTTYTPFGDDSLSDAGRLATYANGVYYWRVRAIVSSGSDVVTESRRFTKAAPLPLLGPADGTTTTTDPVFEWAPMTGAHHYRLVVSEYGSFEAIYDLVELSNTRYTPFNASGDRPDVYHNSTYYWMVEALDATGHALTTSAVRSFTKNAPLALIAPAAGAQQPGTPTFIWSPTAGAYRYRLRVMAGPGFSTPYDEIVTDATQYIPYAGETAKAMYNDGPYQWTVEALDNRGQVIARSEARLLTIVNAAPVPLPSPTPGETLPPPGVMPTRTAAPTLSPTFPPPTTPTATLTLTPIATPTATVTPTASPTPSATATQTRIVPPSPTRTPGPTPTGGFIPPSPTPAPGGRTDTDEPNDYAILAVPLPPGTHRSYISHARDLDWFKIYVGQPRSELRVTLRNLPADYDLALLRDPGNVDFALPNLRDTADLTDVDQTGQSQMSGDIDDLGVVQDVRPLQDISAQAGQQSEQVITNVQYHTGWYYILVKGYNGAHSRQHYTLTVEIRPPTNDRHCTVDLPNPPGVIIGRWVPSTPPKTLILVNKRRMEAFYGTGAGPSEPLLRRLAGHVQVSGVIEPLEDNPAILSAYRAWDDEACNPEAANRVTEAIKDRIDEVLAEYPTIEQVLIIGNDDIIPFHRIPDEVSLANESAYLAQVSADPNSPFYSSLEQGYVLSDDFYVDDEPLAWRGRQLYVPDRPIGRLVEAPEEIASAIETFLQADGRLSLKAGLVFSSDVFAESSNQVADRLRSTGVNVERKIDLDWTSWDLSERLLSTRHDVNVVNARFSHREIWSPGQPDSPLTVNMIAELGTPLSRSLFLTAGSHAGLSVPDRWASEPTRLDFSQTFSKLGISSVANTGYGYGIAQAQDYSALLMAHLAEELTQTADTTLGTALVRAKQRFFLEAGPAGFSTYHEKALIEASLFGLPNLRIQVPHAPIPTSDTRQVLAEPMQIIDEQLHKRTVDITPRFVQVDTPAGSYLRADDGTTSWPGRPIQPRFVWDIAQPGLSAHGALLAAATYTDIPYFDPVVALPLTDMTTDEPGYPTSAWAPVRLHTINRLWTPAGPSEQLVVIPGQFRGTSPAPAQGIERRYNTLRYDVYYSSSPDWTPPTIWRVRLEETALGAEFWVDVTDPSGIERVVITYTHDDGTWTTQELQHIGGFTWQTMLPFFDTNALTFVAQAVDSAGNVALSGDKGRLFGRPDHKFYLQLIAR